MNYSNYGESGARLLQRGDPGSSQLREGDMVADRELALTKDNRVVEERDRDALFLLVAKGQVLTREKAAEHGLRSEDGRLAWGPVAEAPAAQPEAEIAGDARVDLANGITEAKAEAPIGDAPDLGKMNHKQLLALAKERKVEVKANPSKADLIAALTATE